MMPLPFTVAAWRRAYRDGTLTPRAGIARVRAAMRADDPAWILQADDAFIDAQLERLGSSNPADLPLYGVPFAVKDNIDVAGLPTTAACPAFAYVAPCHATCVQRLVDAGAVLVGKTNLDQFATGLVGTRSPYGEVPNSFDPRYVSGGSSSGSASVVARGLVPFALGTDTAGSGRVPAGFNNVVGLKPTPGRVGMRGVVPACRTLDVVSVFALTVPDAALVASVIDGPDDGAAFHQGMPGAAWFRQPLRVAVPAEPGCDAALGYEPAFAAAVARLRSIMRAEIVPIDMSPLFEVTRLLYDGPWVAERYAAVRDVIERQPSAMDPVVRGVIEAARRHDAVAAFEGRYRLHELQCRADAMWRDADVLMVPTAVTCPTRAAVAAEPVALNSELGRYTNFVNLLGLCAMAVPSSITPSGLPFGVTFIAPGGADAALAHFSAAWHATLGLPIGARLGTALAEDFQVRAAPAAAPSLPIAVVGAHLSGMPLHGQLADRGCRLVASTRTAPRYRLYALPDTTPPKPGLARVADGEGASIEVEVYDMPMTEVGSFVGLIAPPLGLGSIELADGRWVKGFICEPAGLRGARDITHHGGWRAYRAAAA